MFLIPATLSYILIHIFILRSEYENHLFLLKEIEIIPGVEITNYWSAQNRREFHTLGYFFDLDNNRLNKTLTHYQSVCKDRARKIVAALQKLNYKITYRQALQLLEGLLNDPDFKISDISFTCSLARPLVLSLFRKDSSI